MDNYKIFEGATVVKVDGLDLYFDNGKILSVHEFETYISDHKIMNEGAYKNKAMQFVGSEIKDSFCNGFFDGSKKYNLNGSDIVCIRENDDEIIIEVQKINGEFDYGRFDGGWKTWKNVYTYLEEWTGN